MAFKQLIAATVGLSVLASVGFAYSTALAQFSEPTVGKLVPPQSNWFFIRTRSDGTMILDAATGKMRGMVNTSHSADLQFDPAGRHYYVSESIWSLGNRGLRQNIIAVYDTIDLKLQSQIKLPGRMLVGGRTHNFVLSSDGSTGFVYDLTPASLVHVIDLAKGKFIKTIELPGCASLMPNSAVGFSALCGNGSLATVDYRSGKITHSAPFFDAASDPIFDNFNLDAAKQTAVFLSYTGLIYTAQLSASPTISEPFSLQAAAGFRPAAPKPLDLSYYPGGDQPSAWHIASNRLFVLVHPGEYWSHIAPGTQLWVVDIAAKKVIKRIPLADPVNRIEVTQGENPFLYLSKGATGFTMNANTYENVHDVSPGGPGIVQTLANPL